MTTVSQPVKNKQRDRLQLQLQVWKPGAVVITTLSLDLPVLHYICVTLYAGAVILPENLQVEINSELHKMAASFYSYKNFWWIYIEDASLYWDYNIIDEPEPLLLYALD